jgi:hypothetical protein
MLLAIIGLVCLEARVKFKNIDFQTEADFACYCKGTLLGLKEDSINQVRGRRYERNFLVEGVQSV